MEDKHITNITKLTQNFISLIKIQVKTTNLREKAYNKLQECKALYNNLSKKNNKKVLLFCLDAFFFQYKTFTIEMENLDKFRSLMNNRLYCDYYKLYNLILTYVNKNKDELCIEHTAPKSLPIYKELEPFEQYKIEDIKEVHNNIIILLNSLYLIYNNKCKERDQYNEKHHVGFTISNLLNTLTYESNVLLQQICLYVDYLAFFHISHKKQMKRLTCKYSDFYNDMEENLQCTNTYTIEDIDDTDGIFDPMMSDGEDNNDNDNDNNIDLIHQWCCNNLTINPGNHDTLVNTPETSSIEDTNNTPETSSIEDINNTPEPSSTEDTNNTPEPSSTEDTNNTPEPSSSEDTNNTPEPS